MRLLRRLRCLLVSMCVRYRVMAIVCFTHCVLVVALEEPQTFDNESSCMLPLTPRWNGMALPFGHIWIWSQPTHRARLMRNTLAVRESTGVLEAHIAGLVLEREVHIYSSVGCVDTPIRVGLMGGTPVLSILHRAQRVHYDALVSPKCDVCAPVRVSESAPASQLLVNSVPEEM